MNKRATIVLAICLMAVNALLLGQDAVKLAEKYAMKPEDHKYARSIEIKQIDILPHDKDEIGGVFLQAPVRIVKDDQSTLYIVDQKRQTIFNFDTSGNFLRKVGQPGQGPGDLAQPRHVAINGKYFITGDIGNMRIQYLDSQGEFIRSFKVFKSFESVALGDNGYLYCIPTMATRRTHLIEVYSQEGNLVNTFGELMKSGADQDVLSRARLAIGNNHEIFVAFVFFPIVRVYSMEGSMIREIRLDIPLMVAKEDLNHRMNAMSSPQRRVPYWMVNDSIKIGAGRIYLSSVYPRLEITVLSEKGEIMASYTKKWDFDDYMISYDFEVIEMKNRTRFYVLEDYPESRVHVLEAISGNN